MKAKHSGILLLGLLLLMMFGVLSQTSDKARPTCPALEDGMLQSMLVPSAWVRADWNANTKLWDIQCNQIDSIANMPSSLPVNNAANGAPRRTPRKHPGE